ncbi:MAG: putative ABC transporter permease [Anaerovoracaceae bacterium]
MLFIAILPSTLIEYVAGLIFIKGMKVQLWDYSGERFNVQGIICLRFSIYWAMLGAMYYFLIHPHILDAVRWLSENITFSFFIGMFYGVFMVDLIRSLGIVTKVRTFARENEILIKYE